MLSWTTERVEVDGAAYVDHVSTCRRFRIERGYGAPSEAGPDAVHDGHALLERDEHGALRWAEDARSVQGAKAAAERRASAGRAAA